MYPNFVLVKHLQQLEFGLPVKIAHKLNDEVLKPRSLEKTIIMIADALFHKSTLNGLECYAKNGFPYFKQTANFIKIIRNWWDTFNVIF